MEHDVIIVGGSFAGLSAATYLARGRRSVRIVDAGRPRNRFSDEAHGFLSRDGTDPQAILATARSQLQAYTGATIVEDEAIEARSEGGGFALSLGSGGTLMGRKMILAFGLADALPDLPGLKERWGKTVLHCPYCHGIEFSDLPLGVLYSSVMSVHQALMIAEWGPTTLYLNGASLPHEQSAQKLAGRGVSVEEAPIAALHGERVSLSAVEFRDGRRSEVQALYIAPRSCLGSPLAEQLGCAIDEGPLGPIVRTDSDRMTTVPGIYAAGDIARAPHAVSWAVADGVTAGTAAHRALVFG